MRVRRRLGSRLFSLHHERPIWNFYTISIEKTMAKTLQFYFDFGSPNAYLAYVRLPGILERTGASMEYKIMLLGGVFQATGNTSPAANKLKGPNSRLDLTRFANKYNIPFQLNPHFPVNTLKLMRGAVVAEEDGFFDTYAKAVFEAMWVHGLDMEEEAVFRQVLDRAGLDSKHVFERMGEDSVKERLKRNTAEAVARGVFGAPTFFVDDEMFFGQDRLEFVEDALLGITY
jgi:2-hydroxychromene-2-carboxylate isomerase